MLLAIGPRWQPGKTESSAAKDFVRMELAAALGAKRPLCPLLIDRREPLEAAGLPEQGEAIQAQDHAAEAVMDGEEEERGKGRDAGGGEAECESQRCSDGCECLSKGG